MLEQAFALVASLPVVCVCACPPALQDEHRQARLPQQKSKPLAQPETATRSKSKGATQSRVKARAERTGKAKPAQLALYIESVRWGREAADPVDRTRFRLLGHHVRHYVGPRRVVNAKQLHERLVQSRKKTPDAVIVITPGPSVTVGDTVATIAAAKAAGFSEFVLHSRAVRVLPGGIRVRAQKPISVRIDLAQLSAVKGIVPPAAGQAIAPGEARKTVRKGWIQPNGRAAPIVQVNQRGSVLYGKRKPIRNLDSAGAEAPLRSLLDDLAAHEMRHRVNKHTKKRVAADPLVIRADEFTEACHIYSLIKACAKGSIPIRRAYLGVRAAPVAKPGRDAREKKVEPARKKSK